MSNKIITLTENSDSSAITKVAMVTLMHAMFLCQSTEAKNGKPINFYDGGTSRFAKLWLEIWPTEFHHRNNPKFPMQVTPVWQTKLALEEAGKIEKYKLSATHYRLTAETASKYKAWLKKSAKAGIEGLDIKAYAARVKELLVEEAKGGSKTKEDVDKAIAEMGL